MELAMGKFIERPHENEKQQAIKFVTNLLDQARLNKKSKDIAQLSEVLRLLDTKRYGLVWEQHAEKVEELMKTKIPVFEEIKERKIKNSTDPKYNFLLEGDNLHSLHLLERTNRAGIDLIYIDPPYNTGSKDFIYNDKIVNADDEWIHSKWLSFMNSRLKIAIDLLKDNGILLISIGDNEYANLKLLMDELLPNGYVTTIHVEMSTVQGMKIRAAKKGGIVKNAEYLLVYSKDGHKDVMKHPLYNLTGYDHHYNQYLVKSDDHYDCLNLSDKLAENEGIVKQLQTLGLVKPGKKLSNSKINEYYDNSKLVQSFINKHADLIVRDHTSIDVNHPEKYEPDKVYKYEHGGRSYLICKNKKGQFTQKIRFSSKLGLSDDFAPTFGPLKIRGDWWKDLYRDMGNVNKEGKVKFSNGKKPLRLIEQLLKGMTDKNSLILDFFAGSGTTGEAVELLNQKDGGHRHFILATSNENKIAEKVTYQRMKNILDLYPNQINLKYFRTKFISKNEPHLEEKLLANVKTLVELQNLTDLEGSHIAIVITTKQVSELNLTGISKVYMRSRVRRFMEPEEQERYDEAGVQIIDIPDEFFAQEMEGLE